MGFSRRLKNRLHLNILYARELYAWARGRGRWHRVTGESMSPTLRAGDCVLVRKGRDRALKVDDIVIVRPSPQIDRSVVKRISTIESATVVLKSDNPEVGIDSRHFGAISNCHLEGRATLVFRTNGNLAPL